MAIFNKRHRGYNFHFFIKRYRRYTFEICQCWPLFINIFEIKVLLKSPPQAPILGGILKEFSKVLSIPPPSKLQKFGEGGGIERVIPGYVRKSEKKLKFWKNEAQNPVGIFWQNPIFWAETFFSKASRKFSIDFTNMFKVSERSA